MMTQLPIQYQLLLRSNTKDKICISSYDPTKVLDYIISHSASLKIIKISRAYYETNIYQDNTALGKVTNRKMVYTLVVSKD